MQSDQNWFHSLLFSVHFVLLKIFDLVIYQSFLFRFQFLPWWFFFSFHFCNHNILMEQFNSFVAFQTNACSINFRTKEIFLEMWFCPTQEQIQKKTLWKQKISMKNTTLLYPPPKNNRREKKMNFISFLSLSALWDLQNIFSANKEWKQRMKQYSTTERVILIAAAAVTEQQKQT